MLHKAGSRALDTTSQTASGAHRKQLLMLEAERPHRQGRTAWLATGVDQRHSDKHRRTVGWRS